MTKACDAEEKPSLRAVDREEVSVTETGTNYRLAINAGGHILCADEPEDKGGTNKGPMPYELLLSALGACTAMTVRMYADRKEWPLDNVEVHVTHRKIDNPDAGEDGPKKIDEIGKTITLEGDLSGEQRERLLEIAEKCPVNRTLHSNISFV